MERPPPPPPWKAAVERSTPSNVTLEEMLNVIKMATRHHLNPQGGAHGAQPQLSHPDQCKIWSRQLVTLTDQDWEDGPH
eukprot:9823585-Karenia_brevis.AAC.1